jgi:hypothetical protein
MIMGVVFTLLVLWDIVVVFFNSEQEDSISRIIQGFSVTNWAIPFAFGFVCIGHFFWPGKSILPQPWGFLVMGALILGVFVLGAVFDLPRIPTLIPALLGVAAGHYFWPLPPL